MSVFLLKEHNSVFIHIPKTGGWSIRKDFFENNYIGPKQGHVPEEWQNLFSFAFVRNPYDRLISAYLMIKNSTNIRKMKQKRHDLSFNTMIDILNNPDIGYGLNTWEAKVKHHAIPQTHPFNCLNYAKFVGRFENLDADFREVCKMLKITNTPLPKQNFTIRTKYQDYYTDETKKFVAKYYEEDLDTLKYTYEN